MIRKIIHIDEEKCNGCGLCATACHEGAIDIINGKAKLVRENFCDGFGDCLPGCPTGAITFEEREAPAYDETAVQENKKKKELQEKMKHLPRLPDADAGTAGDRRKRVFCPRAARFPPAQLAGADQASTHPRALLCGRKAPDRGGLHGIRLRQFPSGVHAW